ncbi:hypothetical protein NAEGRDRAFT_59412 [Naegleria gruberi]|uniref:Ubiquitin-conjugating enzyme family protein n=1 Tax=Naegleria gruberi TaxID=5762 RepID=D2VWH1_NAEGR|nr:uncharacterized protein NAEGRDRAFT_59412 [Naegleria gruberi]EFC38895.1 hypothetical protein NAEGRDRAFT_59412 [Naegleria gruberi]|eukprot:XP_002671639.1 hypothetical protein NAEGRDRAFT_59412 [Naegleria gruberi strain NEG-M]
MSNSSNSSNSTAATPHSRALKRLSKDFIEIQNNPLDTVYAEPFENNLFHWYATLLAPQSSKYYGIIISLEITFPNDYPHSPPTVKCLTPLYHSHVYRQFICLDMLETHHSEEPYMGWSSSYSCLSILLQLQAFLLEEEHLHQSHIEKDIKGSRATRVQETGHWPQEGKIYPMAPHWNVEEVFNSGLKKRKFESQDESEQALKKILIEKLDESSIVGIRNSTNSLTKTMISFEDFPNEILIHIFSYLSFIDLKRVETVCKAFQHACDCKYLTYSRELICFHSKSSYKEETLGIGLWIELKNDETIKEIKTPLDFISESSFFHEEVYKSVWGQPIHGWIPLFINQTHAKFSVFKNSLSFLLEYYPKLLTPNRNGQIDLDSAEPYVELLCKLMNNMVVEIMKGVTHASIKALYGYLYFHRWLIYLMENFPNSLDNIKKQVQNFINDEKFRTKNACPNIGEFLPKLTILGPSGFTWDSIKSAVVDETGTRNALWVVKKHPKLSNIHSDQNNYERCQKSWEENMVSCKLIMFHVFFLRNVVEAYGDLPLSELGRMYDINFGAPPKTKSDESLEDVLQREVFKIQKVSSFEEYFEYVGFNNEFSSATTIAQYLRNCVKKSEQKGYHTNKNSNRNNHSSSSNNNYRGNNHRNNDNYHGNNNRNYDNYGNGRNGYSGNNRRY